MKKEEIAVLFRQHYSQMIRLAKRMLYDNEESRDVVSEVKWSDRYFDKPAELKSLLYFMENNHMERALVTSLTKRGVKQLRTVRLEFIPSAIYAYTVGYNRFKAFLTSQNL